MTAPNERRNGTSKSGWCLTKTHESCAYPACKCHCHGCPFKGCDDRQFQGGK